MVKIRRNKSTEDTVYLTAEEGKKIVGSAVGGGRWSFGQYPS